MNISLGKTIKELRLAAKLTQTELAERIHISTSAVSSYEINVRQPSYDVLIKIAKLFNVTTDFLLGATDKYISNKNIIDITDLTINQRNIIIETILEFKNSIRRQLPEEIEETEEKEQL